MDQKLRKEEVEAGGKWESQRMMALGPESSEQKLGDAAGSGPGGPCLVTD